MDVFVLASGILLWIVVLLNLILTLALIRRVNTLPERGPAFESGPAIGTPAPDYTATTLDGERSSLADSVGRPTTFVFVSPNCKPCHELLPSLKNLGSQARGAGAELVLVSGGGLKETEEMVHILEGQIPVLVASREENPFFDDYKISATPSYCSLDEQGTVVAAGHPSQSNPNWQKLTTYWARQMSLLERR